MDENIQTLEWQDEIRLCPVCGYKDGFHFMFRKEGKTLRWLLIRPSCHRLFDAVLTAAAPG